MGFTVMSVPKRVPEDGGCVFSGCISGGNHGCGCHSSHLLKEVGQSLVRDRGNGSVLAGSSYIRVFPTLGVSRSDLSQESV